MTKNEKAESEARTVRKGRPSSLLEIERICACGQTFKTKTKPDGTPAKGYPTTYCSRACSRQVANKRAGEATRAEYEADPRRCPCGMAIAYEDRHHIKSYCSDACRSKYGKKRERNEANYEIRVCRNENCPLPERKFEWYRGGGHGYYCSNACAMTHTKTKHHHAMRDGDELFDSSYEAFVWGALKIARVPVERFSRKQLMSISPRLIAEMVYSEGAGS